MSTEMARWKFENAFMEWIRLWPEGWTDPISLETDAVRPLQVLDHFEDCQDILPDWACDCLALPQGSTYADAVQKIRGAEV